MYCSVNLLCTITVPLGGAGTLPLFADNNTTLGDFYSRTNKREEVTSH